jgi:hypothetical protein
MRIHLEFVVLTSVLLGCICHAQAQMTNGTANSSKTAFARKHTNRVRYFKPIFKKSIGNMSSHIKVLSLTTKPPPLLIPQTTKLVIRHQKRMNELKRFQKTTTITAAAAVLAAQTSTKRSDAISILTNVNFLISKLEREIMLLDQLFSREKYGHKLIGVIRGQVKPAYEKIRAQLCNSMDFDKDDDQDVQDDSSIYFKKKENSSATSNLIEDLYKKDLKRRTARFSKNRRITRRICF